jgi:hypothetical protein
MRDPNGQPWMALMKLRSKEHMEQFRTGLLYMNTLAYFRDLEADTARGAGSKASTPSRSRRTSANRRSILGYPASVESKSAAKISRVGSPSE